MIREVRSTGAFGFAGIAGVMKITELFDPLHDLPNDKQQSCSDNDP